MPYPCLTRRWPRRRAERDAATEQKRTTYAVMLSSMPGSGGLGQPLAGSGASSPPPRRPGEDGSVSNADAMGRTAVRRYTRHAVSPKQRRAGRKSPLRTASFLAVCHDKLSGIADARVGARRKRHLARSAALNSQQTWLMSGRSVFGQPAGTLCPSLTVNQVGDANNFDWLERHSMRAATRRPAISAVIGSAVGRFRPHVRLSMGRPVSQYAGNEGCSG